MMPQLEAGSTLGDQDRASCLWLKLRGKGAGGVGLGGQASEANLVSHTVIFLQIEIQRQKLKIQLKFSKIQLNLANKKAILLLIY